LFFNSLNIEIESCPAQLSKDCQYQGWVADGVDKREKTQAVSCSDF